MMAGKAAPAAVAQAARFKKSRRESFAPALIAVT
jgi:hypothetical protein